MAYISVSKMLLEGSFLKRKFLLRKYLMAYISNSKMPLERFSQKGNFLFRQQFPKKGNLMAYISNSNDFGKNYQKRKLYARKFGKMPEKS